MFEGKWTMSEVDQMDVHFFDDLMGYKPREKEVYLSDVW